jgi:hypothetical protein
MTEDEHIRLVEVGDRFRNELQKITSIALAHFPGHMYDEALAYLQDKTSLHGLCPPPEETADGPHVYFYCTTCHLCGARCTCKSTEESNWVDMVEGEEPLEEMY